MSPSPALACDWERLTPQLRAHHAVRPRGGATGAAHTGRARHAARTERCPGVRDNCAQHSLRRALRCGLHAVRTPHHTRCASRARRTVHRARPPGSTGGSFSRGNSKQEADVPYRPSQKPARRYPIYREAPPARPGQACAPPRAQGSFQPSLCRPGAARWGAPPPRRRGGGGTRGQWRQRRPRSGRGSGAARWRRRRCSRWCGSRSPPAARRGSGARRRRAPTAAPRSAPRRCCARWTGSRRASLERPDHRKVRAAACACARACVRAQPRGGRRADTQG